MVLVTLLKEGRFYDDPKLRVPLTEVIGTNHSSRKPALRITFEHGIINIVKRGYHHGLKRDVEYHWEGSRHVVWQAENELGQKTSTKSMRAGNCSRKW
jgi:hypothetical protein